MKFTVKVCRTAYGFMDIEVEAETPEQADKIALEKAGDYLFSESSSDYTTDGVIIPQENMIRKIIIELTKPVEITTDGETLDKIWSILENNGYDLIKVQKEQNNNLKEIEK